MQITPLTLEHSLLKTVWSRSIHLCQTALAPWGARTHTGPWFGLSWGVGRPWQQASPKLANEYRSPSYSQPLGPWDPRWPCGIPSLKTGSDLFNVVMQIVLPTQHHQSLCVCMYDLYKPFACDACLVAQSIQEQIQVLYSHWKQLHYTSVWTQCSWV